MRIYLISIMTLLLVTLCISDVSAERLKRDTAEDITTGGYASEGYTYVKDTDSLESLVATTVQKAYSVKINPDHVHIEQREDKGDATIAIYTFTYHNTAYEGTMLSYRKNGKWYDLSSYHSKLYQEIRVRNGSASGNVSIPGEEAQSSSIAYRTFFGRIHDPNIRRVHIEYESGPPADINLEAGQTHYMDYKMTDPGDDEEPFSLIGRVTMYSIDGQLLYKEDYSEFYARSHPM